MRCHALAEPSIALYWHIGLITIRFASSSEPSFKGEKSVASIDSIEFNGLNEMKAAGERIAERHCIRPSQYAEARAHSVRASRRAMARRSGCDLPTPASNAGWVIECGLAHHLRISDYSALPSPIEMDRRWRSPAAKRTTKPGGNPYMEGC